MLSENVVRDFTDDSLSFCKLHSYWLTAYLYLKVFFLFRALDSAFYFQLTSFASFTCFQPVNQVEQKKTKPSALPTIFCHLVAIYYLLAVFFRRPSSGKLLHCGNATSPLSRAPQRPPPPLSRLSPLCLVKPNSDGPQNISVRLRQLGVH